ncbi:MAG: MFS transporter [Rhizonema sp. NSF051]|nr:MFS transporter [Rhizonema sp. NSF051]
MKRLSWLPPLNDQVWILAFGRLLSEIGSGFTLFYAPIFFVNQVGLSATSVGIGLGSASISGVIGRIMGGTMADSQFWGRRRTLLLSAIISALASLVLAFTSNFPIFVVGNLLMGLGTGLYWPATEAVVADVTPPQQLNEAYALTRLADNLGLGLGVIFGGMLIASTGANRSLFVIDAISFLIFSGVIYVRITETNEFAGEHRQVFQGWATALRDRRLQVYVLVNILFTIYVAQIQSTMPLYFSNFVRGTHQGFAPPTISALFTWYIVLTAVFQLPVARVLNRFRRTQALMLSASLWAGGFALVWFTAVAHFGHLTWAVLALLVLATASVTYNPAASSLVVELAPASLRGIYLSINSLCWAIGYFIGPPLGGWSLDQSLWLAHSYWLYLALSVGVAILILLFLDQMMRSLRSPTS